MIRETKLIVADDDDVFNKTLIKTIDEFQKKKYHVEIQYSCSISGGSTMLSALVIASSHE